jgi:peptide/nickel transport system substrate-binding protein
LAAEPWRKIGLLSSGFNCRTKSLQRILSRSALPRTRVRLSLAAVFVTFGCLAALSPAGARPDYRATGGTLQVVLSSDLDYVDPGLSYLSTGWEVQYAVGCKLLNYPDKQGADGSILRPEVATSLPRISSGGRTYTFRIRKGYRFANGDPVTASSFAAAFNRDANPTFQSPAQFFLADIVGAKEVIRGKRSKISGIRVTGDSISFTLQQPAPDFLSRVAMPFFQAIPPGLAGAIDSSGVTSASTCGPYYVDAWVRGKSLTLKRNPYYDGPRPHNSDAIVYTIGNTQADNERAILDSKADYAADGIPAIDTAGLARRFGVNRQQFWVRTRLGVAYFALNHDRPLFRNNPRLAQAVNFAIDRRALLQQAGFQAGVATDHILPPGVPGFRQCGCYPLDGPDLTKAKALAKGNTRSGQAMLWTSNRTVDQLQAQILQFDLEKIGLHVTVQTFSRAVQIEKESTRGAAYDITSEGWMADYNDPFDFVNVLLSGTAIRQINGYNVAYYNSPEYNKRMADAARLVGGARYSAYGQLDLDIMKTDPPWIPTYNFNARILVSKRVGCMTFNPVYQVDLAALCVK